MVELTDLTRLGLCCSVHCQNMFCALSKYGTIASLKTIEGSCPSITAVAILHRNTWNSFLSIPCCKWNAENKGTIVLPVQAMLYGSKKSFPIHCYKWNAEMQGYNSFACTSHAPWLKKKSFKLYSAPFYLTPIITFRTGNLKSNWLLIWPIKLTSQDPSSVWSDVLETIHDKLVFRLAIVSVTGFQFHSVQI